MKIPREELRQAEAECNRLANEGEGKAFMSIVRALEEKYAAKVKVTLTPHRVGEHPQAPGGIHIYLEGFYWGVQGWCMLQSSEQPNRTGIMSFVSAL